jgi:hypothetical protein
MIIDQMNTRVEVNPRVTGAGAPAAVTGAPAPTSPLGGGDAVQALRPLVLQIVEQELLAKLKLAGLR